MSTRSCIAKPRPGGWEGVYLHSDGYPRGVGRIVWRLMAERYDFNAEAFWREIIFDNLDGWSALHCFHPEWGNLNPKDWDGKLKIGVDDWSRMNRESKPGEKVPNIAPVSYKGDPGRGDPALKELPFTELHGDPLYIEWVYIVDGIGLRILKGAACKLSAPGAEVYDHGEKFAYRHVETGYYEWNDGEPDWDAIQAKGKSLMEEGRRLIDIPSDKSGTTVKKSRRGMRTSVPKTKRSVSRARA